MHVAIFQQFFQEKFIQECSKQVNMLYKQECPKILIFLIKLTHPQTQGCVLNLFDKFKGGKEIVEVHICLSLSAGFLSKNISISIKGHLKRWGSKIVTLCGLGLHNIAILNCFEVDKKKQWLNRRLKQIPVVFCKPSE